MTKIKSIRLKNYCGYRDITFDFTSNGNNDGTINPLAMFIGCNGIGKSTVLHAIELLSSASRFKNRDTSLNFRKLTYDPDYDPDKQEYDIAMDGLKRNKDGKIIIDNSRVEDGKIVTETIEVQSDTSMEDGDVKLRTLDPNYLPDKMKNLYEMEISGIFSTDQGDKEVILTTRGVQKDELSENLGSTCFHYFIDADNPSNMNRFQIPEGMEKRFVDLAETIYGYKCEVGKPVDNLDKKNGELKFYTDVILTKPWGDRVHFKRMSDGEKKIATVIRHLCDPEYMGEFDIVLMDNAVMHVYAKRHRQMLKKIMDTFPDKQFIMTTHSSVLIDSLPSKYIYDVEEYKIKEAEKMGVKLVYPDSQSKTFKPSFQMMSENVDQFAVK